MDWYKGNLSLPELDYIEYHVSWHCNLKCKGCGHYSNLCDEPMFGDWEQYKNDLHRIHELVDNVKKIRLMGGEPLLNPELSKFVYTKRKEFEGADIRVVSNGLLIPTCSEELLIAMRETGTTFDITQYPPTSKIVDKIRKRCCENGVQVNISEPVTQFFAASDGSVEYNIMESWNVCESRSCHFLHNGEMSVCGAPIIAKILGDKTESKAKYSVNDIVNIYDANLTSEEFIKKMSSPITMCKYCDKVEKNFFDWQGGYKKYFSSQLLQKDIRDFSGDE